jgi:predicted RNA-binding protein with PUA-like domain
VLELGYLKQQTALAELPLVQKGSRLSVMPVTPNNGRRPHLQLTGIKALSGKQAT